MGRSSGWSWSAVRTSCGVKRSEWVVRKVSIVFSAMASKPGLTGWLWMVWRAVSYTHLDVYKRQPFSRVGMGLWGGDVRQLTGALRRWRNVDGSVVRVGFIVCMCSW